MSDDETQQLSGTRRTQLANERTFLAWTRSGLGALAAGIAIARILPNLHVAEAWPYEVLGIGFCLLGMAFVWLGVWRLRRVARAQREHEYAPISSRVAIAIGIYAGVLALLTIVVVIADP